MVACLNHHATLFDVVRGVIASRWAGVCPRVYLLPALVSFLLANLAIRSRRQWLHGLAIFWIIGVMLWGHWDRAIG